MPDDSGPRRLISAARTVAVVLAQRSNASDRMLGNFLLTVADEAERGLLLFVSIDELVRVQAKVEVRVAAVPDDPPVTAPDENGGSA